MFFARLRSLCCAINLPVLIAGFSLGGAMVVSMPVPAMAGPAVYSARLSQSLESPRREILNGVVWRCAADQCAAPSDGSRPMVACQRTVRAFGPVSAFASPKGKFTADEIKRCNGG